ncbi:MAG TPA: hypothetical protein VGF45_01445 [Polyangia bacterium]
MSINSTAAKRLTDKTSPLVAVVGAEAVADVAEREVDVEASARAGGGGEDIRAR